MKAKKTKTDSYGSEVPVGTSFDEYWSQQDNMLDLSLKESLRQRDERKKNLGESSKQNKE